MTTIELPKSRPSVIVMGDRQRVVPQQTYSTVHRCTMCTVVKRHKPEPIYETDALAGMHGDIYNIVIRLPVCQVELNAIGLIWADLKGFVSRSNSSFIYLYFIECFTTTFPHTHS